MSKTKLILAALVVAMVASVAAPAVAATPKHQTPSMPIMSAQQAKELVAASNAALKASPHAAALVAVRDAALNVAQNTGSGATPLMAKHCAWAECSYYFNRNETWKISHAGLVGVAVLAFLPGPLKLLAIAVFAYIVYVADKAVHDHKCIKLNFLVWPTYSLIGVYEYLTYHCW
ncbi:MAG: hypothetical protein JWS12_616 [Candidatus Saccharibacteria bacterium]|nr:hypothetical protein [Candidatus Saccharibacteria bacterium]